uniref:Uncharacterized protein n=1 Tax=Strigops habroptila TaxID=2489341 RepID=A0A672V4A9_STRHB
MIPFPPCNQNSKQTYPLHALQRTFLLSCSLVVLPLYRSSKETLQNKAFLLVTLQFQLVLCYKCKST